MQDDTAPPEFAGAAIAPDAACADALTAGRVDILFHLGRHCLFLPFAALCVAATLMGGRPVSIFVAASPLLLQLIVAVGTERLCDGYAAQRGRKEPLRWAWRYTLLSGISGAIWGVAGALLWFVPHNFAAQAYLSLAFLGITAVEFIGRSAYRPAFLVHTLLSLTPLMIRLLLDGAPYASMTALLMLFFAAVLYSYCERFTQLLDEAIALRLQNTALVASLSAEKRDAERARDVAEASARAKSAFIANISHEIRTPLNALLGMAQLLERSDLDRNQKSHIQVVLEAGRGLKTLLDDVLALSGSETPDEDNAADCDAGEALRTVARLLQPRAWEKRLRLTVTAPATLPPAYADPRRVRQVLLKLADNALKFTERGGVELRAEAVEEGPGRIVLRFSVADTGLGLAAEAAARVFEPFATGENSYARRHDGAGLGLAVAKRLVESMAGTIGFDSAPGEGSNFWFTVPAAGGAVPAAEIAAPIAADCPPPAGISVLLALADDEACALLAALLEPFGNRVVSAATLAAAISTAGRDRFDVIVSAGAQADMMAAAPGVSAPVIALQLPGMPMPMAAASVLRWPAPPGALYATIGALLGRSADAPLPEPDNPAIDAAAFAGLEKSLGLTTLVEILHSYLKTAEDLSTRLDAARQCGDWDAASRLAQDIAGAAGGLGLSALTNAARGVTQKMRDASAAADLGKAVEGVVGEHARVKKALAALYPDLAA